MLNAPKTLMCAAVLWGASQRVGTLFLKLLLSIKKTTGKETV